MALGYGKLSSLHIDPMKKKPIHHFHEEDQVLSLGGYGCNLSCRFCQNHTISQEDIGRKISEGGTVSPHDILSLSKEKIGGVAFTYNEPILWFEFIKESAPLIREAGLVTVMVTNGYINPEPLEELLPLIDAFSVDLKAFGNAFYSQLCGASLQPVLDSLKAIADSDAHLEIDYLVIPGWNDNPQEFEEMLSWYLDALDAHIPLHINRYYPHYRMKERATPLGSLKLLRDRAQKKLSHVHVGNVPLGWDHDY